MSVPAQDLRMIPAPVRSLFERERRRAEEWRRGEIDWRAKARFWRRQFEIGRDKLTAARAEVREVRRAAREGEHLGEHLGTSTLRAFGDTHLRLQGGCPFSPYWQFRYRMWFAYKYYPMREESCFVLGTAWPVLRRMAAELGQRLVDVGTLCEPSDLYFLTRDEIESALVARGSGKAMPEYLALTADRRELREARKRLHPPGTMPEEARENPGLKFKETQFKNDDSSDTLRGIPVSPGTITAPASRIMNAQEFDRMQPGSILVCPMTCPA